MNKKNIEKKLKSLGFWVIENEFGLFQIQDFQTGNILSEEFNLEGLENKIERLEAI